MGKIKIPVRRYGGKACLAPWVVGHMPEHTTYIEPFCGSASVLLAKPRSQAEILNDADERIINVFRAIQTRPFELAALLWATPYSSLNWREHTYGADQLLDAQMYMAQSVQFYAGNTGTSTFSIDAGHANKNKAHVWADWFQRVMPAALRLKDVQLIHSDALAIVERFKELKDALFYIDPPYEGHEDEYEFKANWGEIESALKGVQGKVIVSAYADTAPRFDGWRVEKREVVTRARTGAHKMKADRKTEFLFLNFPAIA